MKAAANEIIKKKRIEKGWSQRELARQAGLSYNTIYKIEANKVISPNLETYEKVCKALGIKISHLL